MLCSRRRQERVPLTIHGADFRPAPVVEPGDVQEVLAFLHSRGVAPSRRRSSAWGSMPLRAGRRPESLSGPPAHGARKRSAGRARPPLSALRLRIISTLTEDDRVSRLDVEGRLHDALLRDDAGNQVVGGDIKSQVQGRGPGRGHRLAPEIWVTSSASRSSTGMWPPSGRVK